MLHTRLRENRPACSREDFLRVFIIYGRGGHFCHVTSIMKTNIHFLVPESVHIKFGSEWHSNI